MRFNILISGALYSSQSAYSALQFSRAAIEAGHSISQVFFYQDGASNANQLSAPIADEFDAVSEWADFAAAHQVALIACVSAAERRGVLNAEQAIEFAKQSANLHPQFKIAGLGALHQAALDSDRMVSFK